MTFELVDFSTPLVQGLLDILGETHFLPPPQPLKQEPKVPDGIHLPSDPLLSSVLTKSAMPDSVWRTKLLDRLRRWRWDVRARSSATS
jgi:hypothetical protein